MKLLLDSHAYLWWLVDRGDLAPAARDAIADRSSAVFVSPITIWELTIKEALGRLDTRGADLAVEIAANGFLELAFTAAHARRAGSLPRHHDDPFDRALIAQAQSEGLALVTRDGSFAAYGVEMLKA